MHLIVSPVPFINSAISPEVFAVACDLIILPVATELRVVTPLIEAISVFLAVLVLAFVFCAICPDFFTFTFLDVVDPLSGISTSVNVGVLAEAIGLIRLKLADVDVAFSVPESSFPRCFIIYPLPFINRSIIPLLDSVALSHFFAI
jgi:hypothetical protein